jgi:hypothetical protein
MCHQKPPLPLLAKDGIFREVLLHGRVTFRPRRIEFIAFVRYA